MNDIAVIKMTFKDWVEKEGGSLISIDAHDEKSAFKNYADQFCRVHNATLISFSEEQFTYTVKK